MSVRIQNAEALATSALRRDAIALMEAAYAAIDTEAALRRCVSLEGDKVRVGDSRFELKQFDRIKLIGFGKVSCVAVKSLESILGPLVKGGIVIDINPGTCEIADTYVGTHPMPSKSNIEASSKVAAMAEACTERDLVLVVVSGGGSALLCWPEAECEQGIHLYQESVRVGMSIQDLNLARKHISALKGGGLASLLYPATVVGLIFCDVPGGKYETVASGPTYFDESTVEDARVMLARYGVEGVTLMETPKDRSRFERVHNIPVVSSLDALAAIRNTAEGLGYAVVDVGANHYESAEEVAKALCVASAPRSVVCGGGEPRLVVPKAGGSGGRCQYMALSALSHVPQNALFVSFASDGADNGPCAGAIADAETMRKAEAAGLDVSRYLQTFDAQKFFEQTGDCIHTGPTEANVSDLFMVVSS